MIEVLKNNVHYCGSLNDPMVGTKKRRATGDSTNKIGGMFYVQSCKENVR